MFYDSDTVTSYGMKILWFASKSFILKVDGFYFCKTNFMLDVMVIVWYHKRGKIHWAKHSRFQPYEVYRRNNFVVHWPPVFITYLKLKLDGKLSQ